MIGYSINDLERERERYEAEHKNLYMCNCDICGEPLYAGEMVETIGEVNICGEFDERYVSKDDDAYVICKDCSTGLFFADIKGNPKCKICEEPYIIKNDEGEEWILHLFEVKGEYYCENCIGTLEL